MERGSCAVAAMCVGRAISLLGGARGLNLAATARESKSNAGISLLLQSSAYVRSVEVSTLRVRSHLRNPLRSFTPASVQLHLALNGVRGEAREPFLRVNDDDAVAARGVPRCAIPSRMGRPGSTRRKANAGCAKVCCFGGVDRAGPSHTFRARVERKPFRSRSESLDAGIDDVWTTRIRSAEKNLIDAYAPATRRLLFRSLRKASRITDRRRRFANADCTSVTPMAAE